MKKTNASKYIGVLLVWLLFLKPSVGSHFTVWSGPGCNTQAFRYSDCGCSNFSFQAGYEFVYEGQTAFVYSAPSCQGTADAHFDNSASGCTGIPWTSVFIQCS
ncbi:hypothetical protein SUGI_0540620 [Cryptomeria japonica]|nr:hypothetical protein SUGI_0540620 [Cryptomeria japonica]